jgi:DNA-binding CsgD family transcriptional regulator
MPQHPDFPPQHHEVIVETEALASVSDIPALTLSAEHTIPAAETNLGLRHIIVEDSLTIAGLLLALQMQAGEQDERVSPPTVELDVEQHQDLGNILPTFSPLGRQIVVLVSCFKKPPATVAAVLNCTMDVVQSVTADANRRMFFMRSSARPAELAAAWNHQYTIEADREMVLSATPHRGVFWRSIEPETESHFTDRIEMAGLQLGQGKIVIVNRPGTIASKQDKCGYLATLGLSNKEIGSFLDIGEETVKTHLNRLYKKRRITTRSELAKSYIADGTFQAIPGTVAIEVNPSEEEIVRYVSRGLSNKQIASRVHLSEQTVKTHLRRVFQRNKLTSREQISLAMIITAAAQQNANTT